MIDLQSVQTWPVLLLLSRARQVVNDVFILPLTVCRLVTVCVCVCVVVSVLTVSRLRPSMGTRFILYAIVLHAQRTSLHGRYKLICTGL